MRRSLGPFAPERQIETQNKTTGVLEGFGDSRQQRGTVIRPGAVGQDEPVAGRLGRAMQHAAYAVSIECLVHRTSSLSLCRPAIHSLLRRSDAARLGMFLTVSQKPAPPASRW
jgi:hypothetical protein